MNITVYSGPFCQACAATKRAMDKAGIEYSTWTTGESQRERFRAVGHRSLPVVVVTNDAGEKLDEWHGFRPDKINALEVPS
ncbi:glutaredoxin domain-containing protein [Salinicola halophyticus]|uniref:glutaredoxin domain-containing protein n=1 Tax=Salinicola halophyticus TaxID=1808881 RepID=UPI000DA1B17E|nr:glutaredoxin domain-containing protein [Salinicola halophyticus]